MLLESHDAAGLLAPLNLWGVHGLGRRDRRAEPPARAAGRGARRPDALVRVARTDPELVRKRARRAVASVVRNCAEAGVVLKERFGIEVDVGDMEAVDAVVEQLRVEGDEGAKEEK